MPLNATQLQGIQFQAIYQKIAKRINNDSLQNLPALKKTAQNLKNNFLNSKDIFIKAKKAWENSTEFLEDKALRDKINKKSIFEKALSYIKPLKNKFENRRKEKIRLLDCKLYELEENPNSLIAKYMKATKEKVDALAKYKKAAGEKNKAYAESVISERLMEDCNISGVQRNIHKNISELSKQKLTKETNLSTMETDFKNSNWTLDVNKAKKIVDRGRRTFIQFIKRIPKDIALAENNKKLQEAQRRYDLAPANKVIASLSQDVKKLDKKLKEEKILQKYAKEIFKDIKTKANYEYANEAGKNIQIR